MASWFDSCYRKLFLDYHTQKSAPEVGRDFDAEKWAESLRDAGVQAVSCIAKCGYGWRYYRKGGTGYVHPNLPEGMDILGETIRECHKRGIRVIAYYHTFNSEPVSDAHPEWRLRKMDGSPDGIGICMLGPALEEEMLPQIGEIAKNYDVDGVFMDGTYYGGVVCYCESCKKRFKAETGMELPRSADDASREAYVRWADQQFERIRARAYEVIKENNPNALPSVNWAYTTRQIEPIPAEVGFLSKDISQSNMAASISFQARNWALTGKPFDVMNHMALKWWQEWSVKPVNSLNQESALVLSNGGKTWVGYQMFPQFGVAPYTLKTLKENFDFVKAREKFFDGAKTAPHVGVLNGESQTDTRRVAPLSNFADEHSLMGLHRMFTYSGIPYNSVNTVDFLRNLDSFKAVVISNDQYIPPHVVEALDAYVQHGGKLLLTGKSGMVNETGEFQKNPALEKLLGVSVEDGYPHYHGYIDLGDEPILKKKVADMPLLVARPFMLAKPGGAKALADARAIYLRGDKQPLFTEFVAGVNTSTFSPPGEKTGTAALTIHTYGRGMAAYCAADIFAGYAGNNNWSLKNLVKNLINDVLLGDGAVAIDAPDYVEVALAERENEKLVHLINLVRESPLTDFSGAIENIIGEDILPIYDIGVRVPCAAAPKRVSIGLNGDPVAFTYENGRACFTIPRLEIHECAVIVL